VAGGVNPIRALRLEWAAVFILAALGVTATQGGCRGPARDGMAGSGREVESMERQRKEHRPPNGAAAMPRFLTEQESEVVAAALDRVIASITPGGKGEPRPRGSVIVLDRLDVGRMLKPGSELVIAGPGGLGSRGLYERLLLRSPSGPVLAEGPDDLVGHVLISEPKDALAYVRLFTSPATVHCLRDDRWHEVIRRAAVTREFLFGRDMHEVQAVGPSPGDAPWGIMDDNDWGKSGLREPVATREGEAFVVRRVLAHLDVYPTHIVHLVHETVRSNGSWSRKTEREVTVPGAEFFLPILE
jgi:hypothetical protein